MGEGVEILAVSKKRGRLFTGRVGRGVAPISPGLRGNWTWILSSWRCTETHVGGRTGHHQGTEFRFRRAGLPKQTLLIAIVVYSVVLLLPPSLRGRLDCHTLAGLCFGKLQGDPMARLRSETAVT